VVKQDAVTSTHTIGLTIVDHDPIGVHLGYGMRATRVERDGFRLRNFFDQSKKLAGAGLVKKVAERTGLEPATPGVTVE